MELRVLHHQQPAKGVLQYAFPKGAKAGQGCPFGGHTIDLAAPGVRIRFFGVHHIEGMGEFFCCCIMLALKGWCFN